MINNLKGRALKMDPNDSITRTATELAVLATKGIAETVSNRFKVIRQKKDINSICNDYEELINSLVSDRANAIAIAQGYQEQLNRYEITDDDIRHLQKTVEEVLGLLKQITPDLNIQSFEVLKSLISVDTLKAIQLLGFDYREGIGRPLTQACAHAIEEALASKKDRKRR